MAKRKDPAAVALGRKGGQRKVPKGLAMFSKKRRREIARQGVAARRANTVPDKKAGS
jgi:hypothetical protein